MKEVGFSLGSNLGNKVEYVSRALARLFKGSSVEFVACSSFYRTEPWGHEDQDWFVNLCVVGRTNLPGERLLEHCKHIEHQVGRRDTFRWGPRIIDIDILYYGNEEIAGPDLAIPHKELFNRGFVVIPLAEIRPDLVLSGRRVGDEAERFADEDMQVVAPPWHPGPTPQS